MRKLIALSIIGMTIFATFAMQNSFAEQVSSPSSSDANLIIFKAGDASAATKLCLAAVQNDLSKTKLYVKRLSSAYGLTASVAKVQFISHALTCNNQNLVDFTAAYNAPSTFAYFNKNAAHKYRITPAEVKIIDLARTESLRDKTKPQVIMITSR